MADGVDFVVVAVAVAVAEAAILQKRTAEVAAAFVAHNFAVAAEDDDSNSKENLRLGHQQS